MDAIDQKILSILQQDAETPLAVISEKVNLSSTPCWRRIQKLRDAGVILKHVALCDARKLNVGVTVFVAVRTNQHTQNWLNQFALAVRDIPEILEIYRMSGEFDYLMRVVVPDIEGYDAVYKKLIKEVELYDVTSSFAMEQLKFTTALPLEHAK